MPKKYQPAKAGRPRRPFVDVSASEGDGLTLELAPAFGELANDIAKLYRHWSFPEGAPGEPFLQALVASLGKPKRVRGWITTLPVAERLPCAALWLGIRTLTHPPLGAGALVDQHGFKRPKFSTELSVSPDVDWNRVVQSVLHQERAVHPEVKLPVALNAVKDLGVLAPIFTSGSLDCSQFLSLESMVRFDTTNEGHDPETPAYWLELDAVAACRDLTTWVGRASNEELGPLVAALGFCLEGRGGKPFRGEHGQLVPLLQVVVRRAPSLLSSPSLGDFRQQPPLAQSVLYFGRLLIRQFQAEAESKTVDDLRRALQILRDQALEYLGTVRAVFREGEDHEAGWNVQMETFWRAVRFLQECVPVNDKLGTSEKPSKTEDSRKRADERQKLYWGILRRLLLLFREIPHVATPADLRTWHEGGLEPLPQPWAMSAQELAQHLLWPLTDYLEIDEDAVWLRQQWAQFLVDRIVPSPSRRSPNRSEGAAKAASESVDGLDCVAEKDEIWRVGALRALRWLRVNPKGKGHLALRSVAQSDPDEEVRALAAEVSEKMRRGSWDKSGEARAMLLGAFRELRQAQRYSHGEEVDAYATQRTARKEVRMNVQRTI